ncbi:hypothetical protein [Syntrophomonas erecta]
MQEVSNIRISRKQKNIMRAQLEKIVEIHRDLDKRIEAYENITEVPEYRKLWSDLKGRNSETIQVVSRYMVMKCNR